MPARHKDIVGPSISYKCLMDLWYAYTNQNGSSRCERVQHLSMRLFRQLAHRIAQTHAGAQEALPHLLAACDIQHAADRWWLTCCLLELGARIDDILLVQAPGQHTDSTS